MANVLILRLSTLSIYNICQFYLFCNNELNIAPNTNARALVVVEHVRLWDWRGLQEIISKCRLSMVVTNHTGYLPVSICIFPNMNKFEYPIQLFLLSLLRIIKTMASNLYGPKIFDWKNFKTSFN